MCKLHNSPHAAFQYRVIALVLSLFLISSGCLFLPDSQGSVTTIPPTASSTKILESNQVEIIVEVVQNTSNIPIVLPPTKIPSQTPSVTPTNRITQTEEPTETPSPTQTSIPKPTFTIDPDQYLWFQPILVADDIYGCDVNSKSPKDFTEYPPEFEFDASWVVENTGVNTWETDTHDFQFIEGDKLHKYNDIIDIHEDVEPGEATEFSLDLIAPLEKGKYSAIWGVVDSSDRIVCTVAVFINVVK
jgi:hypothetical protein